MNNLLKSGLAMSLISIFLVKFLWANTPEWWGYGAETGDVVFSLAASFIAAFIFYVIDIWMPKKNNRKMINSRISGPVNLLLQNMKNPIVAVINHVSEDKYDLRNFDMISFEEMDNIFKKLDVMSDPSPLKYFGMDRNEKFFEYFLYSFDQCDKYIKQINELPNLELELVIILHEIRNSKFREFLESIKNLRDSNRNIDVNGGAIVKQVYEYYKLYKRLKDYVKSNKIELNIKE